MKPYRRPTRRAGWDRALIGGILAILVGGCGGEDRRARVDGDTGAVARPAPVRVDGWAMTGSVLYRARDDGTYDPLVTLPGAEAAADTVGTRGVGIPGLRKARFRRIVPSPDGTMAIWEAVGGGGAWIGVIEPVDGASGRVLDAWSGAAPDSLMWAPAGRYLAVTLRHPGGQRSLALFDVKTGARLDPPWGPECADLETCDVTRVEWLGSSLLDVEIRLGPEEAAVPFEIDARALATPSPQLED